MRIGISSPVVVQHPLARSDWEHGAGIAELSLIAEAADNLGYNHLTCSEHIVVPREIAAERGGTYWDPLATLGFLAARTSQIRLNTQVLVLGYHHPLEIAKRYGTLDLVSGGRVTLGVGVGTLREEFELLGVEFEGRGARADDALRALRAALGVEVPTYSGSHYSFDGLVVSPHAQQTHVPLWIGGKTRRSLRRAIELGDGWVPFGLDLEELAAMVGAVELPPGLDIVLSPGRALDPIGHGDATRRALGRLQAAGATIAGPSIAADSAAHYCEQLEALKAIAIDVGVEF